jgi:hypothetical protein
MRIRFVRPGAPGRFATQGTPQRDPGDPGGRPEEPSPRGLCTRVVVPSSIVYVLPLSMTLRDYMLGITQLGLASEG